MSKITYNQDVDALLVELSDGDIDHAEQSGELIVHFSKSGEPVLLEILDAKEFILGSLATVMRGPEANTT